MGDFKLKFNAAKMLLVHPEKGLALTLPRASTH